MRLARVLPIALLLILGLSACQALFTTSLGTALARKTITIPADISASDAKDILASDPSPEACASLLDVLNAQTGATSAGLAVDAAIGATDLSTTVGDPIVNAAMSALAGGSPSSADISALVTSLQDVAGNAAVLTAFTNLNSTTSPGTADAAVLAASGMSPTNMVLVALVVASSALPAGVDPTSSAFTSSPAFTTFQNSDEAKLAKDLVTKAGADIVASGGSSALADALKAALNLP